VEQLLYQFRILLNQLWRSFCLRNGITRVGSLSYTLLLSFIPFAIAVVSIISIFPVSVQIVHHFEQFLFSNFIPSSGELFYNQFKIFQAHAQQLSLISLSFLFVTVFMMLRSLEKHINQMWHIHQQRRFGMSLVVYTSLIVFGPLLLCSGIVLRLYAASYLQPNLVFSNITLHILSYIVSILIFSAVYKIVPATRVSTRYALLAGVIAGTLFELTKHSFVFYASNFPMYNIVYGSVAFIPLFLLWLYISSFILLFCAQIIYVLQGKKITRSNKLANLQVIGHRGARAHAPENTLPGYKVALEQGVDWVDVDVVATRDKILVGYHDLIINPDLLCDSQGNYLAKSKKDLLKYVDSKTLDSLLIKNMDLTELKQYHVKLNPQSSYSQWFPLQERLNGISIATLQEIVDYVDSITGKTINFQIEVKNNFEHPEWSYTPEELAQLVYAFIVKNDLILRVKIQAFDWRILVELNKLDPRIKTAFLEDYLLPKNWYVWFTGSIIEQTAKAMQIGPQASFLPVIKALGGYSYEPEDKELTREKLQQAHSLGLKVIVWGWPEHSGSAFDEKLITKLIGWGVDGFITDKPLALNNILRHLGYTTPKSFDIPHFANPLPLHP